MTNATVDDTVGQETDLDALAARVDAHEEELIDLLELLVATKHLSEELAPELRETNLEYRAAVDELRVAFEHEETVALVRAVGDNADVLVDLLELVEATRDLAEDLAPELQSMALETREPIDELRKAFDDQETLLLLRKIGENTNTFIELLDLLEASQDLLEELVPELQSIALETREPIDELRKAFDEEETLLLLRKIGENTETLIELLDLLEAARGVFEQLVPELQSAALNSRESIDELRLLGEGMADAWDRSDTEPYQTGQRLAHLLALVERLGDPELVAALDAGLTAFTDDEPAPKRGFWGTVKAFWDTDVQRGVGTVVESLRRIGAAIEDPNRSDKYLP